MQSIQHPACAPLAALQLSRFVEIARDPLSQARIDLSIAEADLNGRITRFASTRCSREAEGICAAQDRVIGFRAALDLVRRDSILAIGHASASEVL